MGRTGTPDVAGNWNFRRGSGVVDAVSPAAPKRQMFGRLARVLVAPQVRMLLTRPAYDAALATRLIVFCIVRWAGSKNTRKTTHRGRLDQRPSKRLAPINQAARQGRRGIHLPPLQKHAPHQRPDQSKEKTRKEEGRKEERRTRAGLTPRVEIIALASAMRVGVKDRKPKYLRTTGAALITAAPLSIFFPRNLSRNLSSRA
jgi:hypothetical protein